MFFASSKETSVEVLLDRHGPTPYHYAIPNVGHLPLKWPHHLPQSNAPSRSLAPLVKPHTKLPILATYPYLTASYRYGYGDHCKIRISG